MQGGEILNCVLELKVLLIVNEADFESQEMWANYVGRDFRRQLHGQF
jgi:hypothetical protein